MYLNLACKCDVTSVAVIIGLIVWSWAIVEKEWLGLVAAVTGVSFEVRSIRRSMRRTNRQLDHFRVLDNLKNSGLITVTSAESLPAVLSRLCRGSFACPLGCCLGLMSCERVQSRQAA